VDISGDGGVLKEILREGTGETPPQGVTAKVQYVGTLATTGEKFDSSRDRPGAAPFTFNLGRGNVIKGWDLGVATMKKGELAVLTCRADYAYGESGSPPSIPANSTLKFEVELLDWDDPEPETIPEKLKVANKKKDIGNEYFKGGKITEATEQYSTALEYFKHAYPSEEEKQDVNAIKLTLHLNLAACQLKTKDYSDAVLNCCKALDIDTKNVKALFRRGQAYSRDNEFDKAKADFDECLQLSPSNKEVRQELELLKKTQAEYKKKEKQLFANMFSKMVSKDEKQPEQPKQSTEQPANS
jgi:peptidylprolyl isomerase